MKFLAVCVFVNLGLHYSRGGAVREPGGISCPDHRGGAGSGIDGTCAGQVRVNHDPVPIRLVAIPSG